MKKIFMVIIVLSLVFTMASPSFAENSHSKSVTVEKENFSFPIYSLETGEEVGVETHKVSTKTKLYSDFKEITMTTDIKNENYSTGEVENNKTKSTMLFKGDVLIEVDGEKVPEASENEIIAELTKEDLDAIKPFADKFNAGELSADEYLQEVKDLNLDSISTSEQEVDTLIKNTEVENNDMFNIMSSGGLSWVTYYYKSDRGGYWIKAKSMKGYFYGGLNAFMLDPKAATGTFVHKHTYLSSAQGGLLSSFMSRADSIRSARTEVTIEVAALMGALGLAVITVPTIIGTIAGTGAAAGIAARAYSVSSGAHTHIKRAREIATTIRSM